MQRGSATSARALRNTSTEPDAFDPHDLAVVLGQGHGDAADAATEIERARARRIPDQPRQLSHEALDVDASRRPELVGAPVGNPAVFGQDGAEGVVAPEPIPRRPESPPEPHVRRST